MCTSEISHFLDVVWLQKYCKKNFGCDNRTGKTDDAVCGLLRYHVKKSSRMLQDHSSKVRKTRDTCDTSEKMSYISLKTKYCRKNSVAIFFGILKKHAISTVRYIQRFRWLRTRDARAVFFCFRAGQRKKISGRGGAGRKCSGRGRVTVKPRGGARHSWKFSGPGRLRAAISPWGRVGAGRGVHPCLRLTHGYCEGTFGANKTGQFEEEELHTCRQTLL